MKKISPTMSRAKTTAVFGCLFVAYSMSCYAQETSPHEFQFGIAHATPNTSSTRFAVVSPAYNEIPGSGFTTGNLTRIGVNYAYRISDASSIELLAGIPRRATFVGTGSIGGSQLNPLGSAVPLDPVVMYRYRFGSSGDSLRFNVGAGVNYTYFAKPELTPQFTTWLSQTLSGGAVSSFKSTTSFKSSWNPAVSIGATLQIDPTWKLVGNIVYVPVKSEATIRTDAGGTQVVSKGTLTINPTLVFLGLARSF